MAIQGLSRSYTQPVDTRPPNTYSGDLGFGNPSSPSNILAQPGPRATDFWENFGQETNTSDPAYSGFLKTVGGRGKALWDAAQKIRPNLKFMPGSLQEWKANSGAMPTLRRYKDSPTASDAAPWMEQISGGMRKNIDDIARRTAAAGIKRGGMGVAGGVSPESAAQLNAMKTSADQYGNVFREGMGLATQAAEWDRRSALDTLAAEQEKAKFGYQQAKDYYAGLSDQEKLALQAYGLDTNAAIQMLQEELSGLNASQNTGIQKLGMRQSSWNKDVDYDNALRMRLMDLAGRGLSVPGAGNLPVGMRTSASPAPGSLTGPKSYNPNMDEELGAKKNAAADAKARQFQKETEIAQFLRPYKTDEQFGRHSFNYTPYDRWMAGQMGTPLEAQNQPKYGMQSDTGSSFRYNISR